jgi:hypothetical protein
MKALQIVFSWTNLNATNAPSTAIEISHGALCKNESTPVPSCGEDKAEWRWGTAGAAGSRRQRDGKPLAIERER